MTTTSPPLLVDVHELQSGIPAMLAERYPVVTQAMPIGDYGMADVAQQFILVERKTAADLIASVADGRLKSQVERIQAADVPFLLIEGVLMNHDGETDYSTKIGGRSPHSRLMTLRHSGYDLPYVLTLLVRTLWLTKIRVLWAGDKESTAHIIGALYRTSLKYPILMDGSVPNEDAA